MGKKKKRSRNRLILWLGDITNMPTIQAIIYCLVLQDLLQILLALDINFQHFYALEHERRVDCTGRAMKGVVLNESVMHIFETYRTMERLRPILSILLIMSISLKVLETCV